MSFLASGRQFASLRRMKGVADLLLPRSKQIYFYFSLLLLSHTVRLLSNCHTKRRRPTLVRRSRVSLLCDFSLCLVDVSRSLTRSLFFVVNNSPLNNFADRGAMLISRAAGYRAPCRCRTNNNWLNNSRNPKIVAGSFFSWTGERTFTATIRRHTHTHRKSFDYFWAGKAFDTQPNWMNTGRDLRSDLKDFRAKFGERRGFWCVEGNL